MARSSRRRERRSPQGAAQQAWRQVANPYSPIEVLRPEQIAAIHDASMTVLETIGFRVMSEAARGLYRGAGAEVSADGEMVRLDRGLVMELIAKAPPCFTLRARNPAHGLRMGGRHMAAASVGGPAFASDLDGGRRPGNHRDLCNYLRLVQSLNAIHLEGGGPLEALELPAISRHLDLHLAQIRLMDKNWKPNGLGRDRSCDAIEMACILYGTDREGLARDPALVVIVNTNSPLLLDGAMAEAIIEFAGAGQVVCLTPFTLAGAMSPVTMAGALVQQNAEALAGIALSQIVRPGAPAIYGAFTSNVDMKTGSPAFGTPEYAKACLASGQLARHYGLPWRSSNTTASACVDAQAAYESEMSIWGAGMGHVNLLNQGAGWLEGGLTASFEKLVLDAEMLQMFYAFLEPLATDPDDLGLAAIEDVGPGGHFFGTAHTIERYESAFYSPLISDWRNFETWQEDGSKTATIRANETWKQLLRDYEQPALDPAIDEALVDFVLRRKRDYGVAAEILPMD